MLNTDSRGFLLENLTQLNKEVSPTIPLNFPKERLPGELCQHSLSQMMQCLINAQQNLCGQENKQYYMCKKERDAQLFHNIKTWEQEEFRTKESKEVQARFIKGLEENKKELDKRYAKTPSSLANSHKKWRINADIQQLEWRINYLREIVTD